MPTKKARVAIVLDSDIYDWIKAKADDEGRTSSNLAAFMLARAVKQQMKKEASENKIREEKENVA